MNDKQRRTLDKKDKTSMVAEELEATNPATLALIEALFELIYHVFGSARLCRAEPKT